MLFSYATARSYYSAKPATKGLSAKIPLILYNGAFIIDNQSQEILVSNFFLKEEVNDLAHYFNQKDFYPIVYAFIKEQEKFSYIPSKSTKQQLDFISTRNDKRKNPIENDLYQGDALSMFEIADESYAVENAFKELKEKATGVIGRHDQDAVAHWLEKNYKG